MVKTARDALSDRAIWFLIGLVVLGVFVVLIIVVKHDEKKPQSPQALVAAGFNQMFPVREWKPGMGTKPPIYHPAGLKRPVWHPLPSRAVLGSRPQTRVPGGYPYGTPMNQGGGRP